MITTFTTNLRKMGAIVSLIALFAFSVPVHASPLYTAPTTQTGAATTSPTYMTPGTATTTLIYDSQNASRPNILADQAVLLTQFTGSSTVSVLNIAFEFSDGVAGVDCVATPTACDWYQNNTIITTNASTSQPYIIGNGLLNSYTWTFASSTTQGGATGITARNLKAVILPTYTRYTRVIYTIAPGTLNGAVWGKVIPARQAN